MSVYNCNFRVLVPGIKLGLIFKSDIPENSRYVPTRVKSRVSGCTGPWKNVVVIQIAIYVMAKLYLYDFTTLEYRYRVKN
jgi:hypothetical protein